MSRYQRRGRKGAHRVAGRGRPAAHRARQGRRRPRPAAEPGLVVPQPALRGDGVVGSQPPSPGRWLARGELLAPGLPTLVLLVAVISAWPLYGKAFPATADGVLAALRLHQFELSLQQGIVVPRWAPDVALGYGAPLFFLIAPLPFYAAAGLRALGMGFFDAIQALGIIALIGSAMACYVLARRYLGRSAAALAAVVYTLAPWHLAQAYVRGDPAHLLGLALVPLVLLGIEWSITTTLRAWPLLTASLGALLLADPGMALTLAPVGALWLGSALWRRSRHDEDELHAVASLGATISVVAAAVAGGIAIAAVYLLPGLQAASLVRGAGNSFVYLPLGDYLSGATAHPWQFANPDDLRGSVGAVQALLAGLGLIALGRLPWLREPAAHLGVLAAATVAYGALVLTPAGGEAIVALPAAYGARPELALAAVTLGTALLAGFALEPLSPPVRVAAALVAIALCAWSVLAGLQPIRSSLTEDFVGRRGIAAVETLYGLRALSHDDALLPAEANDRLTRSPVIAAEFSGRPREIAYAIRGGDVTAVETVAATTEHRAISVTTSADAQVVVDTFASPLWRASLDGRPTAIEPDAATGLISVVVPAGQHELTVRLEPGPAATVGQRITAVALAGTLAAGAMTALTWRPRRPDPERLRHLVTLGLAGITVLTGGWVALREAWPLPTGQTTLLAAGGALGIAGPGPLAVIRPEGTLPVRVSAVDLAVPVSVELELFGDGQVWSRDSVRVAGTGAVDAAVPLPSALPPGPYMVRAVARLPAPFDAPRTVPVLPRADRLGTVPLAVTAGPPAGATGEPLNAAWTVVDVTYQGEATPAGLHLEAGAMLPIGVTLRAASGSEAVPGYVVRLIDAQGVVQLAVTDDYQRSSQRGRGWLVGEVVRASLATRLPPSLPPGPYTVDIQLFDGQGPLLREGSGLPWSFRLPPLTVLPPHEYPRLVSSQRPIAAAGGLALEDASIETTRVRAGQPIPLTLTWRRVGSIETDYVAVLDLLDPGQNTVSTMRLAVGSPTYRTSEWRADTVLTNRVQFRLGREVPAGPAQVWLSLDADGRRVADPVLLGAVTVDRRMPQFFRPFLDEMVDVPFGDVLRLVGYELAGQRTNRGYTPGSTLRVTLAWQAQIDPISDYRLTVHLLDPASRIVSQVDMPPGDDVPTTSWVKGEFVTTVATLALPNDPGASYRLVISVYEPRSGSRLNVGAGANALKLADVLLAS